MYQLLVVYLAEKPMHVPLNSHHPWIVPTLVIILCRELNVINPTLEYSHACTIILVGGTTFNSSIIWVVHQLAVKSLTLGACARVMVVCLCVCVCLFVCYHASCFIPRLYVGNMVPLSFLWRSQDMHCVEFVEIALFKSSGVICWSPAFFASFDKLGEQKRQRWLLFKKNNG